MKHGTLYANISPLQKCESFTRPVFSFFFIAIDFSVPIQRERESHVCPVDTFPFLGCGHRSVTGGNCIAGGARVHRVILGPASVGTRQQEVV